MALFSNEEIEQLKQQLDEKKKEINLIYDKLVEAGVVPLPDDFLDEVAGGCGPTAAYLTQSPTQTCITANPTYTGTHHGKKDYYW